MVKGIVETPNQQSFVGKSDNMKCEMSYFNSKIRHLREDLQYCGPGDLEEKEKIRKKIATVRKNKDNMHNKWKELCTVEETRRHKVSVEWNKPMENNDVINNASILVEKDTKDKTNKEATTNTSS